MAFPQTWPIFAKKAESAPRSKKNQSQGQSSENPPKRMICASLCTAGKTTSCSLACLADAVFLFALQAFRCRRFDVLLGARESSSQPKEARLTKWFRRDGSISPGIKPPPDGNPAKTT